LFMQEMTNEAHAGRQISRFRKTFHPRRTAEY